jgi:hypothetical protein
MRLLIQITLGYFLIGALVVTVFRDNPVVLLSSLVQKLPASMNLFLSMAWWVVPVAGSMVLFVPRRELLERLVQASVAVFACTALFLTFTMVKATMPFILPFWADPALADIDRFVHFGHDPWVLTHALSGWINADWVGTIYLSWWGAPAMFLPVMLILFDTDQTRVRRFIWLYAAAWLVIGNVIALAVLSAGPVFYDRLYDGDTFAGLDAALAGSGVATGSLGVLHERLWSAYMSGVQDAGSGISAFPSVHISMITVIALYLAERWRFLLPASVGLVAVYLFLSVYSGAHYAIDGYASIALMVGAWAWLRRRETAQHRASMPFPVPAE